MGKSNALLERVDSISAAVAAHSPSSPAILVVHSGDTAFAGIRDEYEIAQSFFGKLLQSMSERLKSSTLKLAIIPGNHDCDFSFDNDTRKLILDKATSDFNDASPLITCLSVQAPFMHFAKDLALSIPNVEIASLDSWYRASTFQFSNLSVRVNLLNTAWASKKKEVPATLAIPITLLANQIRPADTPDLVITVLHHPYSWLEPANSRALRSLLDEESDLILTGHEHEATFFLKQVSTGENIEYIEGGVLQDSSDDTQSSFNLILVDMDHERQQSMHVAWDADERQYAPINQDPIFRPFQRNKKRTRNEFPLIDDFANFLEDPGVTFSHPRATSPRLSDLFIYPDLREIPIDGATDSAGLVRSRAVYSTLLTHGKVLIIGGDASGKTCLAKTLVRDLRRDGRIPLLINGTSIISIGKLRSALDASIASQYGSSLRERFWQLDTSARAVVFDDYHKLPLSDIDRSKVLTYLDGLFEVVIILAGDQVRFEEMNRDNSDNVALLDLKHLEIMELGLALRSHLIRRWHALGSDASFGTSATEEAC